MKVLHVITGLGVGGAELQLRSLLRHSRHESDVVTLYNPGPVASMLEADGVRVRNLGMRRNTELSALPRLYRLIRAGRYDVVHTHLYRSQIYGRLAARLARTAVVLTTEHSIGETHLERRRMTMGVRALYLATDLCSQATIAVSETVRDRLVKWGVPNRKIWVIPNGLELDRVAFDADARARIRQELSIAQDAQVIGVLGRLDPNKRFDLVIEAAAPLLTDGRALLIVGDGDDRERLEKVAARCGVTDRVVFAGVRHDVAAMLSAMDLFIASSEQETFGLSVLEALSNGLPVLYTTCPALVGIDTDRARQVPGEAGAMRAYIAEELAARRRSHTPVEAVQQRYGIESVAAQVDALYERLLTGGPGAYRGRR
ncbi:MAG: glycosyltransferase [Micromonosporaceae bacterium]|nr:glycosyltransferase [Micromonosporaceae bacterium]